MDTVTTLQLPCTFGPAGLFTGDNYGDPNCHIACYSWVMGNFFWCASDLHVLRKKIRETTTGESVELKLSTEILSGTPAPMLYEAKRILFRGDDDMEWVIKRSYYRDTPGNWLGLNKCKGDILYKLFPDIKDNVIVRFWLQVCPVEEPGS